jgi:3-hydroxyisobutyrate dehydrogenase-like beta-hydroxyacid dehydrogenase
VGEDPTVASTLKLIANYLLLTGIASLTEGVATAQAAGLDDIQIVALLLLLGAGLATGVLLAAADCFSS